MKRKDGEVRGDYDFKLDVLILDVLNEKEYSPYRIKEILNKRFGRKLSWATIKRHLDYLEAKKKIFLYYISNEEKKKNRVYKIK
jgi:DNA-binding PadR family transcriptional regulator